jgi:hypothetical protein
MSKTMTFWKKPKARSKMGAVKCSCRSGHIHMSRLEAGHCNLLHLMQAAGKIKSIRTQVRFPLKVEETINHYADFVVEYPDGKIEVIESKGFETDVWKKKYKLFLQQYPNIPYKIWKKP